MDALQFYPTPPELAKLAFGKFNNKKITRLLEPHAGRCDLLIGAGVMRKDLHRESYHATYDADCCEIDPVNIAVLHSYGLSVVGYDFLDMTSAAIYSHIFMNPPFFNGVDHVLHAWNILHEGEIVAIINAETIKNPFSSKRELLINLLEQHGDYSFVENAFSEADRSTGVEVAIIHLTKKAAPVSLDLSGCMYSKNETFPDDSFEDNSGFELALPKNIVTSYVESFNDAVCALDYSIRASRLAAKRAAYLGYSILEISERANKAKSDGLEPNTSRTITQEDTELSKSFIQEYKKLKQRAWTSIFAAMELENKLQSSIYNKLVKDFEKISELEFTAKNIYTFLESVFASSRTMQIESVCSLFDSICQYHHENRSHYMGWKSNTKHRLDSYKMKAKRFVMPIKIFETFTSTPYVRHEVERTLNDFDRVFSFLDGKGFNPSDSFTVMNTVKNHQESVINRERISSRYFDIRVYIGKGTVHFFPKNKELVDRLNSIVGKHRQWLPDNPFDMPKSFWEQYEKADTIGADKQLSKALNDMAATKRWYPDAPNKIQAQTDLAISLFNAAAESAGINMQEVIKCIEERQQLGVAHLPDLSAA